MVINGANGSTGSVNHGHHSEPARQAKAARTPQTHAKLFDVHCFLFVYPRAKPGRERAKRFKRLSISGKLKQ